MRVALNADHIARLKAIASQATKLLEAGVADTGPGGQDAPALAIELGEMDDALEYFLGES